MGVAADVCQHDVGESRRGGGVWERRYVRLLWLLDERERSSKLLEEEASRGAGRLPLRGAVGSRIGADCGSS